MQCKLKITSQDCCACKPRSEEHTSELQSHLNLVCRLLLAKKNTLSLSLHLTLSLTRSLCDTRAYATNVSRQTCQQVHRHTLSLAVSLVFFFFFFNDTATTEIYTLSLHDALPILCACACACVCVRVCVCVCVCTW